MQLAPRCWQSTKYYYNLSGMLISLIFCYFPKLMEFAVNILAGAVCLWTSKQSAVQLGVDPVFFDNGEARCCSVGEGGGPETEAHNPCITTLQCLPAYVLNLTHQPWSQILPKVRVMFSFWLINTRMS